MTIVSDVNVTDATDHESINFVSDLLKTLNTPYSRTVRRLLRSGDHAMVLSMEYDPSAAATADECSRNWLAHNIVRKANWLNGYDADTRRNACKTSWLEDEAHNRTTETRLRKRQASTKRTGDSLIYEMSLKISRLLGGLDLDAVFAACGFSAGSSTRVPRRKGQPHNKLRGRPHVTPSALPYAIALARSCPSWTSYCFEYVSHNPKDWFEIVPGGRWFTVPKSSKTDRSCEQQPDMNLPLQKGVGSFIRDKLLTVGVNLNDQSRNKFLALAASSSNTLATIDLKSASNSVTRELVRRLLPPDWFDLLDALRCEWVEIDGVWHRLSMFSSMGNGFTFELESLIFWAAIAVLREDIHPSVADTRTAVYGDDLIVPTCMSGQLIELLNHIGFRVNEEKSFVTGPFRESCGLHAFNGVDVTPFYCYESLSAKHERIRLCNRLRVWASTGMICDPTYSKVWRSWSDGLSKYNGPAYAGDAHLWSYNAPIRCTALVAKASKGTRSTEEILGLVSWLFCKNTDSIPLQSDRLYTSRRILAAAKKQQSWFSVRVSNRGELSETSKSTLDEAGPVKYVTTNRTYAHMGRDFHIPAWPHELSASFH